MVIDTSIGDTAETLPICPAGEHVEQGADGHYRCVADNRNATDIAPEGIKSTTKATPFKRENYLARLSRMITTPPVPQMPKPDLNAQLNEVTNTRKRSKVGQLEAQGYGSSEIGGYYVNRAVEDQVINPLEADELFGTNWRPPSETPKPKKEPVFTKDEYEQMLDSAPIPSSRGLAMGIPGQMPGEVQPSREGQPVDILANNGRGQEGLPTKPGAEPAPVPQVSGAVTAPNAAPPARPETLDEFSQQYFAQQGQQFPMNRSGVHSPEELAAYDKLLTQASDAYVQKYGISALIKTGLGRLASLFGGRPIQAAVAPGEVFTPEDFNWTLVDAALFGIPTARTAVALGRTAVEKAFVLALNNGLDKSMAKMAGARISPEMQTILAGPRRWEVIDHKFAVSRGQLNLTKRLGEGLSPEAAAQAAAEDTANEIRVQIPKWAENWPAGQVAPKGANISLAEAQAGVKAELTPPIKPATPAPVSTEIPAKPETPTATPATEVKPSRGVENATLDDLSAWVKEPKGTPGITKEGSWTPRFQEYTPDATQYVYRNKTGDIEGILSILGKPGDYQVSIATKPRAAGIGKQLIETAIKDGYPTDALLKQDFTKAGARFANRLVKEGAKPPEPARSTGQVITPETAVPTTKSGTEPALSMATSTKPPEVPPQPPAVVTAAQPPAPREGFAGNIRLSKFAPEIHADLKAFVDAHPDLVEAVHRGTIPLKETEANATDLINKVGGDPKRLIKKVGQAYNDEEIRAIGGALSDVSNQINSLRKVLDTAGGDSTQNLLKLAELVEKHNYLQLAAIASRAEAGRALGSLRLIQNAMRSNSNPIMDRVLKQVGGKEGYEKIAEAMKGLDWSNPVEVNNFIRNVSKPKMLDYVNEIFVNSILSGPKTHIVNATTNMINSIMSPVERGVSAVIEQGLARVQGRPVERFLVEVPEDIFGAMSGIPEGLQGFAKTLRTGISPTAISKYEYRPSAFRGKVGRAINLPVNALEAADNLNYNINFRQAFNAEILRSGKAKGLRGDALVDYIAETKINPPTNIIKDASDTAEYRLFRAEGKNGIADVLYKFRDWGFELPKVGKVTPLKFVIPFVRTPVNIAKYGLERSPLGFFNPGLLRNLAAKDPKAADQLARAFIGTMIAASIAWYVERDKITGAPPTSQNEKDRFYREGKQPYSIKIGDTWYSYQRLEPFNTDFTLVAIAVNAIKEDTGDATQKIMDAVSSFGRNFVSQSYMSGLSDMINAVENPGGEGSNILQSTAQALAIPASSLTRTVTQATDTTIRQPESFIDKLKAGIPILSQEVKPRLNIFGEPSIRQTPAISPISISKEQESLLNTELNKHQVNIGFVGESINGVKLTDDQSRKYQEIAGPLVKAAIIHAIESEDYKGLSTEDAKSALESAASKAKAQARIQMIQEGIVTTSPENINRLTSLEAKLGEVKKVNTSPYSIDEPVINDTSKYFTDFKALLPKFKTEEIKGPLPQMALKAIESDKSLSSLPGVKLTSINADPAKGDTFRELYAQWQARSQLTDKTAIEEFDKNPFTKNAYLGNISKREVELLTQYHGIKDPAEQKRFVEMHPELDRDPREEWLKSHPTENAQLAILGQGRILTEKAYKEAQRLVKELDIPDSALPDFSDLPSDQETRDQYWKYQEELPKEGFDSRIFRLGNTKFDQWGQKQYGWKSLTDPTLPTYVKSLDALKLKNKIKDQTTIFNNLPTPEHTPYLLKPANKDFALDRFKTDALENGMTPAEATKEADYRYKHLYFTSLNDAQKASMKLSDVPFHKEMLTRAAVSEKVPTSAIPTFIEHNMLPTEGQARERNLLANPDYYQNVYLGILGNKPIDFTKVASEKFETTYKNEYDALNTPEEKEYYRYLHPDFEQEGLSIGKFTKPVLVKSATARQLSIANQALDEQYNRIITPVDKTNFLKAHPDYAVSLKKIEGLNKGVPDNQIDTYVEWKNIPSGGYALERYMMTHYDFYKKVAKDILGQFQGKQALDFRNVPSEGLERQINEYNDLRGAKKTRYLRTHSALRAWKKKQANLQPSKATDMAGGINR